MRMCFSQYCREIIEELSGNSVPQEGDNLEAIAWFRAGERIVEAKKVEPCVDRFVAAEMEPRKRGLGRYALRSTFTPSLGYRYRRRLDPTNEAETSELISRTIAVGYVGALDAQAQLRPTINDADVEVIWNCWIVRFQGGVEERVMTKEHVQQVQELGTNLFSGSARSLGLRPLVRGNLGARGLGWMYTNAGMILRLVQSDQIPDGRLTADPLLQVTNRWPWAAWPWAE
jgi:hypothetical protein